MTSLLVAALVISAVMTKAILRDARLAPARHEQYVRERKARHLSEAMRRATVRINAMSEQFRLMTAAAERAAAALKSPFPPTGREKGDPR